MVRAMDQGYTGHRPRVQLVHGDADGTINYNNFKEAIKQWTNVLGLSTDPTSTETVTLGSHQAKRQKWQNACGYVVLDAFTSMGGDHGPSDAIFQAEYVVPFLALDKTDAVDPEIATCASSGMAGAAGSAGASSAAGGGGVSQSGAGGAMTAGGASPSAGGFGSGALAGNGGVPGVGGTPSGAAGESPGGRGSGGEAGGSLSATGGSGMVTAGAGGAKAAAGGAWLDPNDGGAKGGASAARAPATAADSTGCGCSVAGDRNASTQAVLLALTALAALGRRRRAA